jgi:aspartate aminotransferase
MPASPEIREAIRQGSWIRKMFEDGAVLKAERGEENVFDFTLGNPYGDPPPALSAELARLCADPPPGLHRYMPNAGVPEARRAAALSLSRSTGVPFTEDLLVMTVGAAGALNVALRAILSPGDEVVILAPYFVEYLFYIRNAGGTPVVAETDARFQLDLAAVEAALTPKTRAILINTPNNPTGAVYPEGDLAALERVLSAAERRFGNPVYVISDEPYRKIVFRGVSSTPAAAKIRNTLVAYSHSKDLNLPGERIGYLAVSPRAADAAEVAGAAEGVEQDVPVLPPSSNSPRRSSRTSPPTSPSTRRTGTSCSTPSAAPASTSSRPGERSTCSRSPPSRTRWRSSPRRATRGSSSSRGPGSGEAAMSASPTASPRKR